MKARLASMSEHSHGKGVQSELAPITRELRQVIPNTYAGFAALHRAALAEELLKPEPPKKRQLKLFGVTFLMAGGPATIYGPRAYSAFCEFAKPSA